jgi:SAM-dependent methyltransferase
MKVVADEIENFCFKGIGVVDIGCGLGDLVTLLPKTISYLGIDIDQKVVNAARTRFYFRRNVTFKCENLLEQQLSSPFEIVFMLNWLHHVSTNTLKSLTKNLAHSITKNNPNESYYLCFDSIEMDGYPHSHTLNDMILCLMASKLQVVSIKQLLPKSENQRGVFWLELTCRS